MIDDQPLVEQLEPRIAAMASADGPSAVFRVLLDGLSACVPRVAVFLVRKGELRGWASAGYDDEAADRFRHLAVEAGRGWPGRLTDPDEQPASSRRTPDEGTGPDFGQPTADECHGYAVRVGGRTLAVVLTERDRDQSPWAPAAVRLLVDAAQIRLELDLARRKLHRLGEPHDDETAAYTNRAEEPADRPEPPPHVEASTATIESTPEETETVAPTTPPDPDDPTRSAAMRFAKLVATDIRLYNEESILAGRKQGDLVDRVRDHLERGRETFERRFPDLGPDGLTILRDAYVQVLAGGDEALIPNDARF